MVAAEAAARERDDRPASAMKRLREWEGESGPVKKVANEESRARLEDHMSRRVSPPGRMASPRDYHRRSSSELPREIERRTNENFHPSEAAHHPQSLPSQQIPCMHTIFDAAKEDRKEHNEPAARKMEVDEDYDNNSEDDKRALGSAGPKSSPPNGILNSVPKQEAAA